MSNEGSNRDHANQIKQASNQPRGAAGDKRTRIHKLIANIITGRVKFRSDISCLPSAGDLDPPTPSNESDALRRIGDGQINVRGDLQRGRAGGGETDPSGGDGPAE